MQVYDVRRAIQATRTLPQLKATPLYLQSDNRMAGVTLYASLFENNITRLDLHNLPNSHKEGPHLLNVLKTLDLPAAVALAAERSKVILYQKEQGGWDYPIEVAKKLDWGEKQIQLRKE
jgi:hypothetical protein